MSSYDAQLVEANAREIGRILGVKPQPQASYTMVRYHEIGQRSVSTFDIDASSVCAGFIGLTHQQAIELAQLVRAWRVADAIEPRRPDVLTRSLCEATGCKRQLSFLPVTDMLQTTVYHGEHRHVFEWTEYEDSRAVHEAINAWVASHHQEDQS